MMKQLLILGALFLLAVNWPAISVLLAGEINYDPEVSGEVTLYSTQWCGYCTKTRAYLRRHDVPFTEYDVEQSDEAMSQIMQLQAFGVPVVVVGDTVIRGYQLGALAKALDSDR